MLNQAKARNLDALAITDHGLTLGGHLSGPFFDRLIDPVPGIKLLKGVECNVLDKKGNIDFPECYAPHLDVILLGLHPNIAPGHTQKDRTEMLRNAMTKNPYIDIITHLDGQDYTVDFTTIVQTALEFNIAIELNNSKSRPGYGNGKVTRKLIQTCKDLNCPMVICSDAHAINEVGDDSHVRGFIKDMDFPEELIINRSLQSTMDFLKNRKK
jgi:putative hydrolase